ncbi:MAG: thioredoxin domain-containing protein [Deltaproteobacteria bacterium]|nr:thioredoxin domain-containing protein [Deltaproteobacteria bacterium]
MKTSRTLLVGLALVLLGAAFGAGWYFGQRNGRMSGFSAGVRYGEVQASKKAPIPVRDREHPAALLAETKAFSDLPLQGDEVGALARLTNLSITPCRKGAKRGMSLASSLLDTEEDCPQALSQTRLALAVLRTYGGGVDATAETRAEAIEEAVAVLRVERRQPVPTESHRPVRGNADAAVTLTVFSDFQCPYCVRGEAAVQEFLQDHGDRVRVVSRHLPLTRIHPAAFPAAVATEAAAEQGKYWEMHDALFALGPKPLGKAIDRDDPLPAVGAMPFEEQATAIGLDIGAYRESMRSLEIQQRVQDDMDLARSLGVGGTPAFFFNGREVTERRSAKLFEKLLSKAEAEAEWRFSWGLEPPPKGAEAPAGIAEPEGAAPPSDSVAP